MASAARSLRTMVQDWLSPTRGFRVSHVGRTVGGRYVCVVADNGSGPMAIFFFRHRDGSWCVFPPPPERPALRIADCC
ncbi:hypothetical protein EVC45_40015 [Paraburkholderia sp. UYCP14C]|nr:hypothetical protein EVC45_40015 [Paraburkholderia sp. UYCP14C]